MILATQTIENLPQTYRDQVLNNWIPYGQVFILLLACVALLSRVLR